MTASSEPDRRTAVSDVEPRRARIITLLVAVSFVTYVERTNISVASKFMMPDLSLSSVQMGQIFSSFVIGYGLCQLPAGILGDRFGAKLVLTVAAVWWGVTTVLTGLVPAGAAAFLLLILCRFLLGIGEAATYPVSGRAIVNWVPVSQRASANALVIAGAFVAAAITPALVSWLMVQFGWRTSFYATAGLAFALAFAWHTYAADYPAGAATRKARDTEPGHRPSGWRTAVRASVTLLANRNFAVLCVSYAFQGYVLFMYLFWLYLYLVDVRGFSVLNGGIFAGLPYVAAAVLTPAGGAVCDAMSRRFGRNRGRRVTAMGGLSLASAFLYAGVASREPYTAIAALSLSVGFLESVEGVFWATATEFGGVNAGTAGGLLNGIGNIGGALGTALVPILIREFGWTVAFTAGAVVSLIGGGLWFAINSDGSTSADTRIAPETLKAPVV